MYQERFYRKLTSAPFNITAAYKESDLYVATDRHLDCGVVASSLRKYYTQIEEYIKLNPSFLTALSPQQEDSFAPAIVKEMIAASKVTGIGPFSAVAGAIAAYVGKEILLEAGEIIIENGGDLFLKINEDKKIGVYLGEHGAAKYLTLNIHSRPYSFGIASSSAALGHSLNFGRADLVTVIAKDSIIADSFATALSNRIKNAASVREVIAFARDEPSLEGLLISFETKLSFWGEIEIAA